MSLPCSAHNIVMDLLKTSNIRGSSGKKLMARAIQKIKDIHEALCYKLRNVRDLSTQFKTLYRFPFEVDFSTQVETKPKTDEIARLIIVSAWWGFHSACDERLYDTALKQIQLFGDKLTTTHCLSLYYLVFYDSIVLT